MADERWVAIPGYECVYEVSDQARVRRLPSGDLIPQRLDRKGYSRVTLRLGGNRRDPFVHGLVAEAFIGPRPDGQEVRHGPAGNSDNRPGNLSYGTSAENKADKLRDGTVQHGERNPSVRLAIDQVREIRQRYAAGGITQRVLAAEYAVSQTAIWDITSGRKWGAVV